MAEFLSEAEVQALLCEPKPLPPDYRNRLRLKSKRGHKEADLDVEGRDGSEFRLIVRQSETNRLDFSVVVAYRPPNSSRLVRIRRYNGKNHQHTNPLEQETFYGFHVHEITERYQAGGNREDTYAIMTGRYSDLGQALDCALRECAFQMPPGQPLPLFDATG